MDTIQNCSGLVHVNGYCHHDAIINKRIFHRSANIVIYPNNILLFKAARATDALNKLLQQLVYGSYHISLQLCVISGTVDPVDTNPGSLFEQRLCAIPFVRVQPRIMEICTCTVFSICDWGAQWQQFSNIPVTPKSLFVTITHRGIITVRVSFDNYIWDTDEFLYQILHKMKELVAFANTAI